MTSPNARVSVCAVVTAFTLAACGGSSQPPPLLPSQSVATQSAVTRSAAVQAAAAAIPSALGTPVPALPPGPRPEGWMSPDASSDGPLVYLSDQSSSIVYVFQESTGEQVGEITKSVAAPYGLFVDRKGTLYVVNSDNSTVTAYPRGAKDPTTTWSQDLSRPLYAVVDASGDLFVGNANGGTIVEFAAGSTTASEVIQTPGIEVDGMDLDKDGNLYAAYRSSNGATGGGIVEVAPGSTTGTTLGMKLDQPQGLFVDSSGRISVVETGSKQRIARFLVGKTAPAELLTDTTSGQYLDELAFDAAAGELYVAAYTLSSSSEGQVFSVAYPFTKTSTFTQVVSLTAYSTLGVALSNGQSF
jgi:hypothetical protein